MKKINYILLFFLLICVSLFVNSCVIFKPKGQETEKTDSAKTNPVTLKNRTLKDIRFGSLRLGKYVYNAVIEKKDKSEEAKVFREIKYQFGNLTVTEDTYAPTEKISDKYVLDSNSLLPMYRNVSIGVDEVVNINFSVNSVEGFVKYSSGKSPFDIKINNPVFGDGYSLEIALTLLPLKKGYKINIQFFDYRIEDIREVVAEVTDIEDVRTMNGTISCYKVVVTDSDFEINDKYWISDKDYPVIVKSEVGLIYEKKPRMRKLELVEVY